MKSGMSSFMKGMGAGMIAGVGAFAVGKMMLKDRKSMEKGGAKVIKAASELVQGVQTMFK